MDQETHDVGKKVAAALRQVSSDKRTDGPVAFALALVAVELDLLLSPPAKPEAKLEALPTMERLRELAHTMADGGGIRVLDRLDIATALHALADLNERGKGAEAERLAPCPVGGPGCTPMAAKDKGKWIVGCAHGVFVGVEPIATLPFLDRLGACMAWNAAFERAERFPGER